MNVPLELVQIAISVATQKKQANKNWQIRQKKSNIVPWGVGPIPGGNLESQPPDPGRASTRPWNEALRQTPS